MNILFVCTGNTCRSPMAEAILKSKFQDGEVKSAGIFAGKGDSIAKNSEEVLQEINLKIDHQTRPVDNELLEWADLILTMTDRHKQTLALQYPDFHDKYYTLKEYVLINEEEWKELKRLYTEFEEKRSRILNESMDSLSEEELDRKLRKELKDDITKIEEKENSLPNINITDPFGGDLHMYRETRDELDRHINLLIKKMNEKD
ncbi:low molecular weight protein arginine phosphatase [Halobacillus yeomjeoni]|uniref:Low molecular weight protein arginine phosphatase n=1 Tax=Halobacillus yeomjeoni TaxID=311194 RepID=A0A931HVJ2_9BACI|nr:low molecular weight protein arginine phosphatase [Halobacillus yeomjeoni]MBH0230582.1 low molecular weight protein arginine phosphatase [Halobacillus yeomjeoni]MCA0985467.1 low molecular weight protein arginine phosphatase [Halobacillus yeomjeoni]